MHQIAKHPRCGKIAQRIPQSLVNRASEAKTFSARGCPIKANERIGSSINIAQQLSTI